MTLPHTDHTVNGKWEQNFLFPGGSGSLTGSLTRNISSVSSSYNQLSPLPHGHIKHGNSGGSMTMETTTTYLSGQGIEVLTSCPTQIKPN